MSYPPLELWVCLASMTALILILRSEVAREFRNTREKIIEESESLRRDIMKELERRVPSSKYPLKFEECSYDEYKPTNFEDIKKRLDESINLDEASITLEVINKDEDLVRGLPLPIIHSDFEVKLRKDG